MSFNDITNLWLWCHGLRLILTYTMYETGNNWHFIITSLKFNDNPKEPQHGKVYR